MVLRRGGSVVLAVDLACARDSVVADVVVVACFDRDCLCCLVCCRMIG